MRVFSRGLLAVAAIMLFATQAYAQRGGGRGFGGGGLTLLNQKSVQSELKLSEEQTKKVDGLLDEQRSAFAELRDLDPQERRAKLAERVKAQDTAIAGLLDGDQNKRFKQIAWQQRGAASFGEPEVAEALGLTSEQKDQIMTLECAVSAELRNLFQGGGGGGDREANRKKFQEARAATNEKALGLLSAEQKEKWKALLGEPFKGEIVPPERRGRPGGAQCAGNRATQASILRNVFRLASYVADAQGVADAQDVPETKTGDKPADDALPKARHREKRGHGARHATHRAHGARRADMARRADTARRHHVSGPPHRRPPVDRFSMRDHFQHGLRHGWQGDDRHAGPEPRRGFDRQFAQGQGGWRHHGWDRRPGHRGGTHMAWHRPHSRGPRDGHHAWHSRPGEPGFAHVGAHHGPPRHAHHHMASWRGEQHRHHAGPPHLRGPRGPEEDGPRHFGPDHRRPDGPPRRPQGGASSYGRDVESQLTVLEHKLDELSRQVSRGVGNDPPLTQARHQQLSRMRPRCEQRLGLVAHVRGCRSGGPDNSLAWIPQGQEAACYNTQRRRSLNHQGKSFRSKAMTMRRIGLTAVAILSVTATAMLYAAGKDADASKAELERQLNETLKARVESAQMAMDAVQASFEAETVTLDQVVEAARQLIDAKLAIAKTIEEEIALLEKQLGLMKDRESRVEGAVEGRHPRRRSQRVLHRQTRASDCRD